MSEYWDIEKEAPTTAKTLLNVFIDGFPAHTANAKTVGLNWQAFDAVGKAYKLIEGWVESTPKDEGFLTFDTVATQEEMVEVLWNIQKTLEYLAAQQLLFTEKDKSSGADYALEVTEKEKEVAENE